MDINNLKNTMKPILFNTEMVKAILDERKTVTRRVVKPQQLIGIYPDNCSDVNDFVKAKPLLFIPYCNMSDEELIKASYKPPYQVGDILYVRETIWQEYGRTMDIAGEITSVPIDNFRYITEYPSEPESKVYGHTWVKRPSIHMPKEAARIFLRVTNVRVERLQDITAEGAQSEGCGTGSEIDPNDYATDEWYDFHNLVNDYDRASFAGLFNSTVPKKDLALYGWGANPWVWVIEFERIESIV